MTGRLASSEISTTADRQSNPPRFGGSGNLDAAPSPLHNSPARLTTFSPPYRLLLLSVSFVGQYAAVEETFHRQCRFSWRPGDNPNPIAGKGQ